MLPRGTARYYSRAIRPLQSAALAAGPLGCRPGFEALDCGYPGTKADLSRQSFDGRRETLPCYFVCSNRRAGLSK